MELTEKELRALRSEYFRVASMRTGIQIEYYQLPEDIIRKAKLAKELRLAEEKRLKELNKEKPESTGFFPGKKVEKLGRRPVGDRSITDEPDNF